MRVPNNPPDDYRKFGSRNHPFHFFGLRDSKQDIFIFYAPTQRRADAYALAWGRKHGWRMMRRRQR